MTTINPTLTGSGAAYLAGGSGLTMLEVAPKITIAGDRVDFDGPSGFQRIHHAGWVGLGSQQGGVTPYIISWSMFIRFEWEDVRLGPNIFADSYFWDLTPGTEIELELDW